MNSKNSDNSSQQLSATHKNHTPSNEDQHTQARIEQHWIKTKEMLAQNAQLWEQEGYLRSRSASISASDQQDTLQHSDVPQDKSDSSKSCYKFRTLFAPIPPSLDESNAQSSTASSTETVFMTTINAPSHLQQQQQLLQRAPHTPYVNTIPRSESILYRDAIETSPKQEHNPFMTTTFITEPQFHHTYRPNIGRRRRRGNLPKEVTEYLKRWLILHKKHPYPTEREKQKLADETGLMVSQISNWFINARRRILQPLLESEHQDAVNNDGSSSAAKNNAMSERPRTLLPTEITSHAPVPDAAGTPEPTTSAYHHKYITGNFNSSEQVPLRHHSIDDAMSLDDDYEEPQQHNHHPHELNESSKSQVPPPWVLLPTKLPSMHILDKDVDAFRPE
ncbi:hypothetical protein MAM1_0007c00895 [Mucor ambiguus]|uniref:Homeobox domain-containing protein n=1 Tax=Mucor ambiguus TaxID=91626 RepID=A0A0C9MEL4_9FUNG|nr:hypothetical protein MAM1_0007c00895 [Mucor ambiguus]